MALEGEFSTTLEDMACAGCGTMLPVEVLQSGAGYYIGRFCHICGPNERMSGYFPTRDTAVAELRLWKESPNVRRNARDTDFHG